MKRKLFTSGTAVFLLFCSMVFATTASQGNQLSFVNDFYQREFQDIRNRISGSTSLQKSAVCETGGAILDSQALIFATDRDPLDVVIRRTGALLANLKKSGAGNLDRFELQLSKIKESSNLYGLVKTVNAFAVRQDLYMQAMALQRRIALANPLMDFDSLLFVVTRVPLPYNGNIVGNYQGYIYNSIAIGNNKMSLYMLKGLKTDNPVLCNIVDSSRIQNGRLAGTTLAGGAFLSPDLSYDGKKIAFAWREPGGGFVAYSGSDQAFNKEFCWHLFKVDIDGSNLVQLTDGGYNDFDPCWLPNGRIIFVSERRGGFARDQTWQARTYTLFSMKDDGSDRYCIDYHEANEWHPSVDNNGMIVYSRNDHIDRDGIIAHNMWIMYADGRNSRSWHANYPIPWSTIPGSLNFSLFDGRYSRPLAELNIRAVPYSKRYIATVAGHHSFPYGDLVLIDPNIPDDNKMSQITGITTQRTVWYDMGSPLTYGPAWPLSEDYYICNYLSDIVLLDKSGNRQIIFPLKNIPGVDTACRCLDAIPFRPRQKPPVIPIQTFQGERKNLPEHKRAVIRIINVYKSDIPLPAGTIKELRIVQLLPKATPLVDFPKTNFASQALCRMSLGTAPVESDGSVYCEAPVGKALYFQILDERGRAIHSMRSDTWVHAGENLSCVGCHEDKWKPVTGIGAMPLAMQRPPSKLKPEYGASVEPLTFYRTVKPIFDDQCVPCHKNKEKAPDMSYKSLQEYAFCYNGPQENINKAPSNGIYNGSRTTPGKHGALQSLLNSHLGNSHHDVKLTADETRRVTMWLDLCSMELGAYTRVDEQKAGRIVWPELDCDSTNPQGIENEYPVPDIPTGSEGNLPFSSDQSLKMLINGTLVNIVNPQCADVRISLFDLAGRCVYTKTIKNHAAQFSIDIRNWPRARGIYVLKASTEKNTSDLIAARVYYPGKAGK